MLLYQNKKGGLESFLGEVIIAILAFLLVVGVINVFKTEAEAKTTESICRGSVVLREKSYTEIRDPYTGYIKAGSVATPLLCRTNDKYLPQNKDATKEQVEKEIADLMAKCWETFGEGRIPDVFKEGDQFYKKCFACYTLSLRGTANFKFNADKKSAFQGGKSGGGGAGAEFENTNIDVNFYGSDNSIQKGVITSTEMRQYMFEHPYKAYPESDFCKITGGYCIDSENREDCNKISASSSYILIDKKSDVCQKKNKKACCYTEYGCWNKGGVCGANNPETNQYTAYDNEGWSCPSKMKCFIKKENYYSYGDYIQRYGGPGNMLVLADLKPGETYAISFGSPTGNCGWCTSAGLGAGVGTAAAIITIPLLSATPPGWLVIGSALIAGTFNYVAVKSVSEFTSDQIGKFFERDINTIYLTTLNQIQTGNQCSLVKDIREE